MDNPMDSMLDAQFNQPLNQPEDAYLPDAQVLTEEKPPEGFDQVDTEIASMVTGRQKASEQWRDPWRIEWDLAIDHYEQIYDSTGKEPWQATTFQPLTTSLVERATASLHNMSMGPEAPVEFQPRNTVDSERIDCTNELVQHDLERSQFKVHWTDFLRTLSLLGTAIGKVEYCKKKALVLVKERARPQMLPGMLDALRAMFGGQAAAEQPADRFVEKEMVVEDYATFKNKDPYNIYPQPGIEDFTKDTWVIEKFKITNKELVDGMNNPDPDYQLVNVTPDLLMTGQGRTRGDSQTEQKRQAQGDHDVPVPAYDPDLEHEGFEYWGPAPVWMLEPRLREDESRKYEVAYVWFWVIDGRWVVRKRTTPWRDALPPYVKGNYIRRAGQFYGIGNGQILKGLQIEKNEIRNTRQDNINLMLNKIMGILKDKVSQADYARLVSAPGAIWAFEGIDDIRKAFTTIDMPDITPDSWRASAEVDREAQEATDVIKTTQTIGAGEDQAGNGTFRGQMLNKQQANERFMLYARILEIMGLNAAISKMYERIYQFKSYEQIDKILGEARAKKFQLVPPEEMADVAKLVSLGALTNQNKGLTLAQMRDWYMLFGQEPWVKKIDYARKMYRLGGSGSDPDEVMFSDEELKIYNEQKRLMLQSSMMNGTPPEPGAEPMTDDGLPMGGSAQVSGDVPPPTDGLPRPAMPARGPGGSPFDSQGVPLN